MAGNRPVSRDRSQLLKLPEPSDEAAVDDRNALDKQQIGQPKGSRVLVEDRQIVVGMGRAVRPQDESPTAQIEIEPALNEHCRRHDLGAARRLAESARNLRR